MEHSILEDLYYGRRGQSETIAISEEYEKTLSKIVDKENFITKNFNKEQNDIYREIGYLYGNLESEHGLSAYIEGFKIGLRIGIECMDEPQNKKSE